jgi:hypothetical protein
MSSESGYTGGASIVSEGSNQSFVMEVSSSKNNHCFRSKTSIFSTKIREIA